MQLIQLQEHTWVIQGGANIGVIAYEDHCLIIDSGIDKDTGRDILNKHRIPFYTDVEAGLKTLAALKTRVPAFKQVVAGHGEVAISVAQTNRVIEYTIQRLESILEQVRMALAGGEARSAAAVLSAVAHAQGVAITALPQYVLCNTTVQSARSTLYGRGEIQPIFQENALLWRRIE